MDNSKSKRNILAFKPLGSIVALSVVIIAVLIGIGALFELINHWLWLALTIVAFLITTAMYFYYVHPIRNFLSKGRNVVDVHLFSLIFVFLIYGVICIPDISFLFNNVAVKLKWIPSIVAFSLATCFLCLSIFRLFYTRKIIQSNYCTYHLIDFVNNNLPTNINDAIICDEAINLDLFNRKAIVNEIYSALLKRNANGKVVVGIIGRWGIGKTTYLNNALKRIKEKEDKSIIICDSFSAWKYSDERAFLVGLINQIYESLDIGVNDSVINSAIIRYVGIFLSDSRLNFTNAITANQNDKTIINVINEYLVANNKHIIFVIDNIDRLTKEEMRFVYKAVGDILDINNITFVCLYDEEYVERIINDTYPCNYLDKIVDVKVFIDEPSPNKIYKVAHTALSNYLKKYKPELSLEKLSDNDNEILKTSLKNIHNVRSLILSLNKAFIKISDDSFSLNFIDYFAINIIKESNNQLYSFILEHADMFATAHTNYVRDYYFYFDQKEKTEKRNKLINDNFKYGARFWKNRELIERLFPQSLTEYGSLSSNEESLATKQHRIYSGKFFEQYIKDADTDFLGAYNQVETALSTTESQEKMHSSLNTLLHSYVTGDHVELFKIIEDIIDTINIKEQLMWILSYFRSKYYAFDDTYIGFSLSTKTRAAIIIDKLLIKIGGKEAVDFINSFRNKIEYITLLSAISYWNDASIKYNQTGQDLSTHINEVWEEMVEHVITSNIDVFKADYYRRGILWRLRDKTDFEQLKKYILNCIDSSNIYCFLNEFIAQGTSSNEKKPYILSLEKKNLENFYTLDEVKQLVDSASVSSEGDEIINRLVYQLINDRSLQRSEISYTGDPINLWLYFEKPETL